MRKSRRRQISNSSIYDTPEEHISGSIGTSDITVTHSLTGKCFSQAKQEGIYPWRREYICIQSRSSWFSPHTASSYQEVALYYMPNDDDDNNSNNKKLHGLSPRVNYTDRATAACRLSDCQHSADRGCHVVSVTNPYGRILGFLDRSRYFSIK
jgi:hypothetical protein